MKNLVLAAVAATMVMPAMASAFDIVDNRTDQVMNCVESGKSGNALEDCIAEVVQWSMNDGSNEANKEVAAFVKAETGVNTINGGHEVDAVKQQIRIALDQGDFGLQQELNAANSELAHTRQNTEYMFGILEVVTNHKAQAGSNFAKDPVGYMQFAFDYLEARQADLRRAEDRIRQLEDKLKYYRSGGSWNPTNW